MLDCLLQVLQHETYQHEVVPHQAQRFYNTRFILDWIQHHRRFNELVDLRSLAMVTFSSCPCIVLKYMCYDF
jgi:hypothetical protein